MNDKKDFKTGIYSWPSIFLLLIFIWPVGLYLLIKRTGSDKIVTEKTKKSTKTTSIVMFVLAGIFLLASIGSEFDFSVFFFFLIFASAGVALTFVGYRNKKEEENIKRYVPVIINQNITNLNAIASIVGKSYDNVLKDVKKLINRGILKEAFLDENLNEIIFINHNKPITQSQDEKKIVICPCCGANNTILGSIGKCEYCDSPLK